jgi:serine O-acetyltransferase
MKRIIQADLYRNDGLSGTAGLLKGLLFIPGFRYMYFFRKTSLSRRHSFGRLFYGLFLRRYSFKYGFQIPVTTQIGGGLYLCHCGTLVINSKAKIGKNCNIAHCVTIGQTNRGKLKGCPTIGDNVWIGAGAVIVGKINIGSNVLIAPNSFVNFDVPDNSLAIGNPAKLIAKENPTEGYINFVLK